MASVSPLEVLTDILSAGLLLTFTEFIDIVRSGDVERLCRGRLEHLNRDRRAIGLLRPSIRQVTHTEMTDEGEVIRVATPRSRIIVQEVPSVPSSDAMSSLPSSSGSWIDSLSAIGVDDKLPINCVQTTTSSSMDQPTTTNEVPVGCPLPLGKKLSFSSIVTRFTYEKPHDANDEEASDFVQGQYNLITGRCLSATKIETTAGSLTERAPKETEGDGVYPSVGSGTKRRHRLWNRFRAIRGHQTSDRALSKRKTAPLVKRGMLDEEVISLRQFTITPANAGPSSRHTSGVDAFSSENDKGKRYRSPVFCCERSNRQLKRPLLSKGPRVPRRKTLAKKVRDLLSRFF